MIHNENIPTVSIKMSTYNHGQFIAKAIESVLMQKTTFPFELIIGEDCSTDNTRAVILEYQQRNSNIVKPILNDRNMGMKHTFHQTLSACHGDYIAILDGDDYWTSPHKLQKQVDFMNTHPECSISFHNVQMVYENGKESQIYIKKADKYVVFEDLLKMCFIPSCSVMLRNHLFDTFPAGFDDIPMSDWPLYILTAQHGRICYLDEVMGAWRYHAGGVWTQGGTPSTEHQLKTAAWQLKFYEVINRHLEYRYDTIISAKVAELRENELTLRQVISSAAASPSKQD